MAHEYDLLPRPLDPLFERRELLDDPVVLAIPADSALSPADSALSPADSALSLAAGGPLPLATLAGQPFLAPRSLVAAGAGVTLVPGLAARWLPPRVRLVPPADPVTRRVFTVSRRGGDRKPAVRVVLDALSAAAGPDAAGPAAATPEPGSRRAG